MEIKFKNNILFEISWTDRDYQTQDGILNLILIRLKRLLWEYDTVVVKYPTTIEEFAIYYIATKFCIITNKNLVLKDNNIFHFPNKRILNIAKRKFFFSEDLRSKSAFLASTMYHTKKDHEDLGQWGRIDMPLLFHDYKSIVSIVTYYGVPNYLLREDKYNQLNKQYVDYPVMHWDDI